MTIHDMPTNVTLQELHKAVQGFFAEEGDCDPQEIRLDTDFVQGGYLDSLSLSRFIMFVETYLGIEIGFDDFDVSHVSSVAQIYDRYVL